jgi:hypothetical protein
VWSATGGGDASLRRFVPGQLLATCGLIRLGFRRFTVIAVLTAAVCTPLMLYAVLRFGGTVAQAHRLARAGQGDTKQQKLKGLCALQLTVSPRRLVH